MRVPIMVTLITYLSYNSIIQLSTDPGTVQLLVISGGLSVSIYS